MRIGEVAKAAGVGVETVRFYERKGLIAQPLKPVNGGLRCYPETAVMRISFIRQAQELGFSLGEIAELLALKSEPDADCGDIRRRAQDKREDVDLKIGRLRQIRASLTALIDACPGEGALEFCSILEAMEPRAQNVSGADATQAKQRNVES